MPELPEVETVRSGLWTLVGGKEIKEVTVYYDKIITGDTKAFINILKGQTIRRIDRIGKYLIFILDHNAFLSHLRMEGKYNIALPGQALNKHEHIAFYFQDGTELRYQDIRKFGRMELVDKDNFRREPPFCTLGPEPCDADYKQIYERIHKSILPVKALLLDQTIMAGIGNIYANEICFRMKIHPETPGNRLSLKQTGELVSVSLEVLAEAVALGGTSVHSFAFNGVTGRYQERLQVHMRKNCPVCGGSITRKMVRGRGTYYCGSCQTYPL